MKPNSRLRRDKHEIIYLIFSRLKLTRRSQSCEVLPHLRAGYPTFNIKLYTDEKNYDDWKNPFWIAVCSFWNQSFFNDGLLPRDVNFIHPKNRFYNDPYRYYADSGKYQHYY